LIEGLLSIEGLDIVFSRFKAHGHTHEVCENLNIESLVIHYHYLGSGAAWSWCLLGSWYIIDWKHLNVWTRLDLRSRNFNFGGWQHNILSLFTLLQIRVIFFLHG
jgi:hypothetical protein